MEFPILNRMNLEINTQFASNYILLIISILIKSTLNIVILGI